MFEHIRCNHHGGSSEEGQRHMEFTKSTDFHVHCKHVTCKKGVDEGLEGKLMKAFPQIYIKKWQE